MPVDDGLRLMRGAAFALIFECIVAVVAAIAYQIAKAALR